MALESGAGETLGFMVGSKRASSGRSRLGGTPCAQTLQSRLSRRLAASAPGSRTPHDATTPEHPPSPVHATSGGGGAAILPWISPFDAIPLIAIAICDIHTMNIDLPVPLVALGGELAVPCSPKSAQRG